jgi:hypothetical protein
MVTLPAQLVARILSRSPKHLPDSAQFTAETWDGKQVLDEIKFGNSVIWKTGAQQVIDFVLSYTTEYDLSLHDRVLQVMWEGHRDRQAERGNILSPESAPKFYRNGQQISADEAFKAFKAYNERLVVNVVQLELFEVEA